MTAPVPADVRAALEAFFNAKGDLTELSVYRMTAALAAADRVRMERAGDVVALLTQRAHLIEYGERVSADDVAVNYREAATLITTLRAQLAAAEAERDAARVAALREAADYADELGDYRGLIVAIGLRALILTKEADNAG